MLDLHLLNFIWYVVLFHEVLVHDLQIYSIDNLMYVDTSMLAQILEDATSHYDEVN